MRRNQIEPGLGGTTSISARRWQLRRAASFVLVTVAAVGLGFVAPVAAQVVNEGTEDQSLECVAVFVNGVDPDDSLNVRLGPGVTFDIVQTLEPAAPAIATGLTAEVGASTWYQIGVGSCDAVGWVNSRFLEISDEVVVPTTESPVTTEASSGATSVPDTTTDLPADDQTDGIQLSPLALGLLGLGVIGLLAGILMAVMGRRGSGDDGPPPGMVGPPGGPYYLARVDQSDDSPETIQVGGVPMPTPKRRGTDLPIEPIDEPLSAFPSVPDLASEIEKEADKMTRPSMRLFGTKSLAAGNATEDEKSS